jgi:hypothetical protein
VWNLKPERWESPLVQEKYQEEKACDKRHPYRVIIIKMDTLHYGIRRCRIWYLTELGLLIQWQSLGGSNVCGMCHSLGIW